jgi:aryl-alcohol dehydrogenase-like predicted oxidoreductase
MKYRNLGKSGLKVSEIGLGSLDFGGRVNEQESIAIINQALDQGINFIDTADVYSNGRSEEFVGKAVKDKRTKVVIASKFGISTGESPNDYGASRAHIMDAINNSLKRLDTDYIDLYYIHWPDATTPIEETLRTLNSLVQAGKVRYIACSNFAGWQLSEALWTSRVDNLESFAGVQTRYNMIDRSIEAELVPCCERHGVSVIPWSPLSEGFLTGKYQRGKALPPGTRLGTPRTAPPPRRPMAGLPMRPGMFAPVLTEANFDKLEKWQKFAGERNHTMGELAIAWLLSHPWLASVIAGATNPGQVSANVNAANWSLTAEEVKELV